jgi:rhomboid protease GluP
MLAAAPPGEGLLGWSHATLVRFGAHFVGGERWRLATAIFVHAGLVHLAFNVVALAQIGRSIEEIFGAGRLLFLFMATGIIGNIGSEHWLGPSIAVGASGAVMGLIGAAAGWGQRDGTTVGKRVRNQMIVWLVLTTLFGFYFHVDHAAHVVGFLSGVVPGFLFKPSWLRARASRTPGVVLGVAGLAAAIATVVLVMHPPDSPHTRAALEARTHATAAPASAARDDDEEAPPAIESVQVPADFDGAVAVLGQLAGSAPRELTPKGASPRLAVAPAAGQALSSLLSSFRADGAETPFFERGFLFFTIVNGATGESMAALLSTRDPVDALELGARAAGTNPPPPSLLAALRALQREQPFTLGAILPMQTAIARFLTAPPAPTVMAERLRALSRPRRAGEDPEPLRRNRLFRLSW